MALPASERVPSEKALSEKAVAPSAYAALEAGEYDAYSSTLLDDHPLRSYWGWSAGGEGKRWSERLFLLVCVGLMVLYVPPPFLGNNRTTKD